MYTKTTGPAKAGQEDLSLRHFQLLASKVTQRQRWLVCTAPWHALVRAIAHNGRHVL